MIKYFAEISLWAKRPVIREVSSDTPMSVNEVANIKDIVRFRIHTQMCIYENGTISRCQTINSSKWFYIGKVLEKDDILEDYPQFRNLLKELKTDTDKIVLVRDVTPYIFNTADAEVIRLV